MVSRHLAVLEDFAELHRGPAAPTAAPSLLLQLAALRETLEDMQGLVTGFLASYRKSRLKKMFLLFSVEAVRSQIVDLIGQMDRNM